MKRAIFIVQLICVAASVQAEVWSQNIELETGQPLDLSTLGGPNVQIVITNYDSRDVSYTTADFQT